MSEIEKKQLHWADEKEVIKSNKNINILFHIEIFSFDISGYISIFITFFDVIIY